MKYRYIYGPVSSWRLGTSLGIDILSRKGKVCNFDCVYCQLGRKKPYAGTRKAYVPAKAIVREISSVPAQGIDYLTFSGRGEPTLAKNLGEAMGLLKKRKIAVLTNSALLTKKEIRETLKRADFVAVKLDAFSDGSLGKINRPAKGITFGSIINGITRFKKEFKGRFGLQIMFVDENKAGFKKIADIAARIKPDEIHINTPLRPCGAEPLSKKEIAKIAGYFRNMPALSKTKILTVYDKKRKKVTPLNLRDTLKRRGKL